MQSPDAPDRDELERTADWYRRFADGEARDAPISRAWALGLAADTEVLELLHRVPRAQRQPTLVFSCARLVGADADGPEREWAGLRAFLVAHWVEIEAELAVRRTQTNEPLRTALTVPVLAALPGPLAVIEVGASAGLTLVPERYDLVWRHPDGERTELPAAWRVAGVEPPRIESDVRGDAPLPTAHPEIVWRAGLDLVPLDVTRADDARWLELLVRPEEHDRRDRIARAVAVTAAEPPRVVAGDAVTGLAALAAAAPRDATLVVVSPAVLVYLPAEARAAFAAEVRALGARWVSVDGVGVLPEVSDRLPAERPVGAEFVLSLDGRPLAWVHPLGAWAEWFDRP